MAETGRRASKRAERLDKRVKRLDKRAKRFDKGAARMEAKSKSSQAKVGKAAKKSQKAQEKLPKKTQYRIERRFDEKSGRRRTVVVCRKTSKRFKPEAKAVKRVKKVGSRFAQGRASDAAKDNVGLEAAQKTVSAGASSYRFAKGRIDKGRGRKYKKARKAEKKLFKAEKKASRFAKKAVKARGKARFASASSFFAKKYAGKGANGGGKNAVHKAMQKRRIKRNYAKTARARQEAAKTAETLGKAKQAAVTVARKLQEIAARNATMLVSLLGTVCIVLIIMCIVSSCSMILSESAETIEACGYLSNPAEIDAAELYMTQLEMLLQEQINAVETDYPGYDEYRYSTGSIGHDPYALASYLSALYEKFTASAVQGEIESLFAEMYTLTITSTTETRKRTVEKKDASGNTIYNANGDPETEEEEYTVSILEVTLSVKDLDTLAAGRLDAEQSELYAVYQSTRGLVQYFYSPLDMDWLGLVSSYYGYRVNPITNQEQLHRGVDIAVPTGTPVYAAMDGTVTTAAYDSSYGNYVVIENDGYCTKYAHMDSLSVSAGQEVSHGELIGYSGNTGSSTGSHLHIECMAGGTYYNPIYYFMSGSIN